MGKIEDALRDLVQYHGKRAAKELLGDLPAQVREVRSQLRDVQRSVAGLTKQVGKLVSVRRQEMAVPPAGESKLEGARFTKRTLPSMRRRLDLTQQELARLIEVSAAAVASWETGKSRPRRSNLAQIITLRAMSPAEVDEALGREHVSPSVAPAEIKRLRKRLGLTQAELARLVEVSGATVAAWEIGKSNVSRGKRAALAAVEGMARDELDRRLGREPAAEAASPPPSGAEVAVSAGDVKAIRVKLGLSQRALAKRLGVSVNTVSNWETDRTSPRRKSAEQLLAL